MSNCLFGKLANFLIIFRLIRVRSLNWCTAQDDSGHFVGSRLGEDSRLGEGLRLVSRLGEGLRLVSRLGEDLRGEDSRLGKDSRLVSRLGKDLRGEDSRLGEDLRFLIGPHSRSSLR
jgi:hypothetical protein